MKGKPSRPSYEAPTSAPPRSDPRHDHRNDPRPDPKNHHDEDQTPRVQRPASQAVKQSPYFGLQDAPSPSGRLSDRIQRLKQRYVTLYYTVFAILIQQMPRISRDVHVTVLLSPKHPLSIHSFTPTIRLFPSRIPVRLSSNRHC